MTAKLLIKAIHEGKSSDIQVEFTNLMNEKLQHAIESYRIALTESLFDEVELEGGLEIYDFTSLDEGSLGNLEGFPKHLVSDMTHVGNNKSFRAGKDSPVDRTHTKTPSEFSNKIKDALTKGHHVAVHVDGKVVGGIAHNEYSSSNRNNVIIHSDKKSEGSSSHTAAISKMHSLIGNTNQDESKALFKNKKIEVSTVAADTKRQKKREEREGGGFGPDSFYTDGHKPTKRGGETYRKHNGGSLEDIKRSAAEKIAAKNITDNGSDSDPTAPHSKRRNSVEKRRKDYTNSLLSLQKHSPSGFRDGYGRLFALRNNQKDIARLAKLRKENK